MPWSRPRTEQDSILYPACEAEPPKPAARTWGGVNQASHPTAAATAAAAASSRERLGGGKEGAGSQGRCPFELQRGREATCSERGSGGEAREAGREREETWWWQRLLLRPLLCLLWFPFFSRASAYPSPRVLPGGRRDAVAPVAARKGHCTGPAWVGPSSHPPPIVAPAALLLSLSLPQPRLAPAVCVASGKVRKARRARSASLLLPLRVPGEAEAALRGKALGGKKGKESWKGERRERPSRDGLGWKRRARALKDSGARATGFFFFLFKNCLADKII